MCIEVITLINNEELKPENAIKRHFLDLKFVFKTKDYMITNCLIECGFAPHFEETSSDINIVLFWTLYEIPLMDWTIFYRELLHKEPQLFTHTDVIIL